MIKGRGNIDNLWMFGMISMLIFNIVVSVVSYFPYVTSYFFWGTVLFLIFAALYIYSFPRSVWPNYLWAVIFGGVAAVAKFLYINYNEALYISYFFAATSFSVVYFIIISRKIKYLKMNRKLSVILFTSYISTIVILFALFSGISVYLYSSFFFKTFLFITLPLTIIGFIIAVYLNINTQTGINTSNIFLLILFSLPFTVLTDRLFYFRSLITHYFGSIHFASGAVFLLFLIISAEGILVSAIATVIEGFINRSRTVYHKLLNDYRILVEKITSYEELFDLFQSTIKNEFPNIKSALFVLVTDDYQATSFFTKGNLIEIAVDLTDFIKKPNLLQKSYFTKNTVDLPSEIIYLQEKYGGDAFIPVIFKSEIIGFVILETRKISHNALTTIQNITNTTVNMFEKIALFQAVIETEKKLEASRHFQETGKMVSFIAHELRSPLSSIMFNMEVIKENILKNKTIDTEYLDISLKEMKRLNDIVEKMLTYGRNIKLSPVSGTVSSFFEDISHLYQGTKNSVSFKDQTKSQTFNFDWDILKSVLINLISNSIQALNRVNRAGEVKVSAFLNKNNIFFEVSDNGPGIPDEHKDSIFEPFYTTRKEGNGLGLATCEKIAKISGGKIVLKSTSEKGSTFQVILPIN